MKTQLRRLYYSTLIPLVILAAWQGFSQVGLVSPIVLPAPTAIARAFFVGIQSGELPMDALASFFRIPTIARPARADAPITVTRAEYDAAVAELATAGLPIKADRDQAWRDFAGWRVNYEDALLRLSILVMAPDTRWNDDARRRAFRRAASQGPASP